MKSLPMSAPEVPPSANAGATPALSIIVVSYNTREMTLDCLRSVVAQTIIPFELIVVDNASTDGSAEAIAAAFPGIRLIASGENHGFAKANNLAAREARAELILLLNPDTLVLDAAIDKLVAFAARRPEAGIWGGRTLFGDRSLNPLSVFNDTTLWGLFCRATGLAVVFADSPVFNANDLGGWRRDDERDVEVVQGSFFLIRRALWNRLGGFDASYVMYGEESDLCRRARRTGAQPRMTPEATIVHYDGASSRRRADKEILVFTAKATMIRRDFPRWQRRPALFLLALWPWSRMVSGDLVARVTGRARFAEAAERWRAVWAARDRWRRGYPRLDRASNRTSNARSQASSATSVQSDLP
jgi:GT2 family glycosyltransferase